MTDLASIKELWNTLGRGGCFVEQTRACRRLFIDFWLYGVPAPTILSERYANVCLQKLNEHAAALFETGEENEVNAGLSIMNELVVTCIPLLLVDEMEEKDMVAVEDMRNRWCSYLGQEMERKFNLRLSDVGRKVLQKQRRFKKL